jgi:hypothetical protein
VSFAQAQGLDRILGIGRFGRVEKGNFVAAAAPALGPVRLRSGQSGRGLWRFVYGRVGDPALPGFGVGLGMGGSGRALRDAHISEARYGAPGCWGSRPEVEVVLRGCAGG